MTDFAEYVGKQVMITGGLGMLGSTLAHKLVALGANITLVDVRLPQHGSNNFNIQGIEDRVRLCEADVRDKAVIDTLVAGKDIIFNFAAQASHNDSYRDPILDLDINYRGHVNILEACKAHNQTAKVLYSGSRLQFGRIQYFPVDENHPLNPLTPYAVNKNAAEAYSQYMHRFQGMRTVAFRIANPYGPRAQVKHHKFTIINWFLRQAMEDKPIRVFGDGSQVRDYIFIDDLVDAFTQAGINPNSDGEVYNIGSGAGTKFIKMAETIIDVVGTGRIEQVPWPADYKDAETGDYVTNIKKARTHLDWMPKVQLRAGLEKTFKFYEQHKAHYF